MKSDRPDKTGKPGKPGKTDKPEKLVVHRKKRRKFKIRRIRVYNRIHSFMPKDYKKWIEQYLTYAGFKIPPETYVGFTVLYALSISYASILFPFMGLLPMEYMAGLFFLTGSFFVIVMHVILIMGSDSRVRKVEEILPDMLRLLAANIRSGLTIDKALLVSARPEFGSLEKELKIASKETLSGITIDNALFQISDTFNSRLLNRSVELLSEGLKRGGDLAKLLESLSDDIRQIKTLKKEVNAMVMMYVIFIFFAVGIGAPLLYAISGFLVTTMGKIGELIDVEDVLPEIQGSIPMSTPQLGNIDAEFLDFYSIVALSVTSIFGGILIGLVQEGKESAGFRYIPILLILSMAIYFVTKVGIGTAFSDLVF